MTEIEGRDGVYSYRQMEVKMRRMRKGLCSLLGRKAPERTQKKRLLMLFHEVFHKTQNKEKYNKRTPKVREEDMWRWEPETAYSHVKQPHPSG